VCLDSDITLNDVNVALGHLKDGKVDGGDGLKGEKLKFPGSSGIKMLHHLFNICAQRTHPRRIGKGALSTSL
jgi:hypothetical protein